MVLAELPFTPVLLVCASAPNGGPDGTHIQGAADDEESWSQVAGI